MVYTTGKMDLPLLPGFRNPSKTGFRANKKRILVIMPGFNSYDFNSYDSQGQFDGKQFTAASRHWFTYSHEWEFALNVSKLNRHPMCWLLQWAGVKQRKPWWDRWLLIAASLFFVVANAPLMLLVIGKERVWWRWAIVGAGYIGLVLFMRFVSRRIEERQLE